MKHTPTPWTIDDRTHNGCGYTIQSPSEHYSRCNLASYVGKADAAHIVKCVNEQPAKDALIAELVAALLFIASNSNDPGAVDTANEALLSVRGEATNA